MGATIEHEGKGKDGAFRLEDEVAAWRSRRSLRQGTTTGKVHVVRITKRVIPASRPSADRALLTARPQLRSR
ncbi:MULTISPECIES: hypothetical protein [unclassified Bradyrhizobium]|uniref:hypothetical protein n=1 Tax=unclassified Bradyrhizobium TaxID=2631580 RepID=UPI0020B32ED7|nr:MULTISPECIES: hypothetical protein [unclassified Bradyrhizobium]MCP3401887.1 hypothetical protein [Bradyrhizobium sp. CCGB20]MCP3410372.1 hypothetical protein [Bradyrhizobium sp. CCGB01]